MEQDKNFLGSEKVGKLIWKLALPTVIAQIINMLYNLVDRIYIGHIPGSGALALTGVGVCFPIIMIISAFAALIAAGGAPLSSIELGRKNYKKAKAILGNCFCVLVLFSIVLTIVVYFWNEPLLLSFGASENTIGYSTTYIKIYSLGTIFVLLTLGLNMFITAQGFTTISMISVLVGAVLNIVLDPIFIFALKLGVKGAAIATIISQAFSMGWVLSFLCSKKAIISLSFKCMRLDYKIIVASLSLGSATFIMQFSESIITVCYNSSLLKYGGDLAVGCMTILTSIMQIVLMPAQSFGQGAQPIISFNYGARNKERVKEAFWMLFKIDLAYTCFMWILCMFCPSLLVQLFTSNYELIEIGKKMLRIYMATILLFGIQISCQTTFTSIGEATSSILVAVMRKFILIVPLIYLLPLMMKNNKLIAVFLSEPISDIISVLFCSVLFSFQFKKRLKELDKEKEVALKDN